MKSERRHELQTNSLANALTNAPAFFREHGSKVLLGIIIILLVALLIHQRTRRNQDELDIGWTRIATARMSLQRLNTLPRSIEAPGQLAAVQKELVDAASSTLTQVMASDNRQIAAEAYLLSGDLNWTIANQPANPAATQPSQQIQGSPEQHLNRAKEAYEKILRVYPDQKRTVTNARFGLASVAENLRDFEAASKLYTEIKNDADTLPAFKTLAETRLDLIEKIRKPVYIAPIAAPATAPAQTAPATAPAAAK